MEKHVPHCKLSVVRCLVEAGKVHATGTARADAAALGIGYDEMEKVVMSLTSADFHKSMTTYADHRVWQDVYRPITRVGQIYVKLAVVDDVLIVSFREL